MADSFNSLDSSLGAFPSASPPAGGFTQGTDSGTMLTGLDTSSGNQLPTTPTTAVDASSVTQSTGGLSSLLTSLGSGYDSLNSLTKSLTGGSLSSLLLAGGEYSLIANQAKGVQAQNKALSDQLQQIGQPSVTAGKNLLDQYTAGGLATPFQTQLDAAKTQNQMNATSQKQQIAQLLANSSGGQNVQSALVSQGQQVDTAQAQADRTALSTAFQDELAASLNLTQAGGAYVQAGIQQEIASNTQLQQQLADLMGMLSQAYAIANGPGSGGAGSGTGASGGGTAGSLSSLVNSGTNAWKAVSGLFGGGTSAIGALAAGSTAAAGAGAAAAAAPAIASDAASIDAGISGELAASGDAALSGTAAAGQATGAGIDAIGTVGAPATSAATGSSAAGSSASASIGTAAGYTAGGAVLADAFYKVIGGWFQSPTQITAINPAPGLNYDGQTLSAQTSNGATIAVNGSVGGRTGQARITLPNGQTYTVIGRSPGHQAAPGPNQLTVDQVAQTTGIQIDELNSIFSKFAQSVQTNG